MPPSHSRAITPSPDEPTDRIPLIRAARIVSRQPAAEAEDRAPGSVWASDIRATHTTTVAIQPARTSTPSADESCYIHGAVIGVEPQIEAAFLCRDGTREHPSFLLSWKKVESGPDDFTVAEMD